MFLKKVKNYINSFYHSVLVNDNLSHEEPPVFLEINKGNKNPGKKYTYPKIIWLYWDEPEPPLLVQLCVQRIKELCPDFEIYLLNKNNINDYIQIKDIPHKLAKAIVADLIRLKLLVKYGGVWCDSSIFLNENLDWVFDRLSNQDGFLFYSDECTVDLSRPISENWFIIAPIESEFILKWHDEFERCIYSDSPTEYYEDIINNSRLIQKLSKPDYLLCYISAIKVMDEGFFNILYTSSLSMGHFYNYTYKFNSRAIAICLLFKNKSKVKRLKLIKITSHGRNKIDYFLKKRLYSKNSLLGSFFLSSSKSTLPKKISRAAHENPPNRR
ncbi:glycosyltransferase family 32 protein [Rosenbergiella epipactidis]|uniref:glycosyltransferase family 32 protein n=1 Tax=Rosenbergiella epipactidis TaxID=1544694 RepID=UPI001F4FF24B|nr:capsular polysaccharide synthesis protein [Rosenbergiella epipactidis]